MRRTRTRALVTAATAALVLALGACASGSGADDGTDAAGDDLGLVKAGTLTVATEGTYRPFSFHEDGAGDLVGYDVEIARAVAEKLGLQVEFRETQWDAIFAGLDAGRFDTIANQVSITPDREAKYLFSEPYTISHGVIVVNEGDTSVTSFEDLAGKTTAQSLTSNWYKLAQSAGADVEPVEGWAQAVALLQQDRVDATINDELTYLDYVKENGRSGLAVAATTDDVSLSAFVFTQQKTALQAAVDGALADLAADGTLTELSQKYFGDDVSQ
ncbi:extracellular solute-binding protein family 3 [Xylanimonas cellulosilytica DSM 15894]|uniref:Extracellular solute-binding protein family 3 n=1 Tax=Xylanimonas cellulosilytica (strain DSM 15894 / JCM 12276 / CECT 5975 / KCTC 9989 / LMG 20990 / NBRC 107835 / XIL07) TaxID=446471 RepID=D1BZK3_XYLCX|nr:amino acid ABC transporter substrate-binding protein [Xylanimonas cellulosilytica]ACZ30157.1 extracellular solute-binding protein family 3 [Xylanimonas cellulosilytica DSM 15894]